LCIRMLLQQRSQSAQRLATGDRVSIPGMGKSFSSPSSVQTGSGVQWVPRNSSNAEINNEWSYTSTYLYDTGRTLILCPPNQTEVRGSVDGISAAYSGKQVIFWA
jgi:hypothetical protein